MGIEILPVEAEDFDVIADIVMDAMVDDFISQNIFPVHLAAPGPRGNKDFYAKSGRKKFLEQNGKLHYLKAVESGSTTPIGFARWQDPAQWAADCALGNEEDSAEKQDPVDGKPTIIDEEFLDRFVAIMVEARKRYFPDGKPHWYCELLCISPAHQRRGVGAALLHWGIDQSIAAAQQGRDEPCYLESSKPGKGLYLKEGYQVVEDLHVDGWPGGVHGQGERTTYTWPAMLRSSKSASS